MLGSGLAAPLARAQTAPDSISRFDAELLVPQAGEIMLEGEVMSWDAPSETLEIRARAFSTPAGRRELGAPRAKTLIIGDKTKLLGAARPLQTLTPQTKVRAVGREKAGEPFVVRALFWSLAAPSAIAADTTLAPAVAGLLPPTQVAGGASVRIVDAGFRLDEKNALAPTFYFAAAATPGAKLTLKQIVGPRSQRSLSALATPIETGDGREIGRYQASYVDARWKSVRVQFEVTAPDAPSQARGEFSTQFPIELPLPALGQKLPLQGTVKTDKGSVVEITEIATVKPQSNFNSDNLKNQHGTLEIKLRSEKPYAVPDARVSFSLGQYTIDGKKWSPGSSGSSTKGDQTLVKMPRPPAEVKTLKAVLTVREAAPQWVLTQYLGTVEFELPVAALLKARPLEAPAPPPATKQATTEGGLARVGAPFWSNSAWRVRGWSESVPLAGVPDDDNPNVTRRLIFTGATARFKGDQEVRWRENMGTSGLYFAPDNAVLARDEAAQEMAFSGPNWKDGAPLELTATAQERRTYSFFHEFRDIPIPPRGETRELGDGWSDESATLRRIGWTKGGSLAIVCENVSLWNGPWYSFNASIGASTDTGQALQWSSQGPRDPLRDDADLPTGAFAITFGAPAPNAKTLDLNYGLTETTNGPTLTFRWPTLSAPAK